MESLYPNIVTHISEYRNLYNSTNSTCDPACARKNLQSRPQKVWSFEFRPELSKTCAITHVRCEFGVLSSLVPSLSLHLSLNAIHPNPGYLRVSKVFAVVRIRLTPPWLAQPKRHLFDCRGGGSSIEGSPIEGSPIECPRVPWLR